MHHLDAMVIFAKVGDLGSISGAARSLGLPKATVSRAVVRLETAYQVRLIERTTRRVMLTEIGRAFHNRCLRIVAEAEDAEAEIAAYQGHPSGTLRVGCPTAIGRDMLAPHLGEFIERFPNIDLQLELTDGQINPVVAGFDVVLYPGWPADSGLIARKIAQVEVVLVASASYAAARGLPKSVHELDGHAVIGRTFPDGPAFALERGKERVHLPTWKRLSVNDQMAALELVRRGLVIAPISEILVDERLGSGEFVRVLPDFRIADPPALYALYGSRVAVPPKLAVFLDFVSKIAARIIASPHLLNI